MKDDLVYLRHILDAIACIEEYTKSATPETFGKQRIIQDAVMRQIEIIGEAAKHVSQAFKQEHQLPWTDMAGMRDKLIHHYFGVDIAVIWRTVKKDIPLLKKQVTAILRQKNS